jgi:membrane-bound serine protease (ClpP class)
MESLDPTVVTILLLLASLACLVLEVLLPTGGALGILSLAFMIGGVYASFRYNGIPGGVTALLAILIVAPTAIVVALNYLPQTPVGKVLVGEAPTEQETAVDDPRKVLEGKIGVARSKMLPSGAVEIEGMVIDAVTRGQAIDPGQYVRVVEVRGNRVVVALAASGQRPEPTTTDGGNLLARSLEELGIESIDDPLS